MRCIFCSGSKFVDFRGRKNEKCTGCSSLVRHRFQAVVLLAEQLRRESRARLAIHVAPERAMGPFLKAACMTYKTLDVNKSRRPDICTSLTDMNLGDGSVDVLFASHVLEHIEDVEKAVREIYRVLATGGVAILEVPIVQARTEKIAPKSNRDGHHWAPGEDWVQLYERVFDGVRTYRPGPAFDGIGAGSGSPVYVGYKDSKQAPKTP